MTFGNVDGGKYVVRLERGEEVMAALTAFCEEVNVGNAEISGVGSMDDPTLAHYRVDTKKYNEKMLAGVFEVSALLGTVALFEDKPLLHLHVTLGDENMHAYAGHLVSGKVSATMEIVVTVFPSKFKKKYIEEIGLKLFDLDK